MLRSGEDGTSFFNLRLLESLEVTVLLDDGHMGVLSHYLAQGVPVIASVDTGDLPYWGKQNFAHAVVVAGVDELGVALFDPGFQDAPQIVERERFESAWLYHEYFYAVIQRFAQNAALGKGSR